MFDWAASYERGKSGQAPRLGENMAAYQAGQSAAGGGGGAGAGAVFLLLIACGLAYVAYVLISGPLLGIAVAGLVAAIASTAILLLWSALGISLPLNRLFLVMAKSFAIGFAAMLVLLGASSLLHHAAGISLLPYILQVFTGPDGSRLDSPYFAVQAPGLLAYLVIYVVGWAAAARAATHKLLSAEARTTQLSFRIAGVMGGTFFGALLIFGLLNT